MNILESGVPVVGSPKMGSLSTLGSPEYTRR
jgi:hypothetical protein